MSLVYRARNGLTEQVEDPLGQRRAVCGDFDITQLSRNASNGDDLRC